MKVRYCDTQLQKLLPCNVGWANYSTNERSSCYDEPAIENCYHLVDPTSLHCPFCGTHIENPFEDCIGVKADDLRIVKEG